MTLYHSSKFLKKKIYNELIKYNFWFKSVDVSVFTLVGLFVKFVKFLSDKIYKVKITV